MVEKAVESLGISKASVRTNAGTKTAVVTHLSKVKPDSLVAAMNRLMLGARILQSGGVGQEESKKFNLFAELQNAESSLCRILLLVQGVAFALALLTQQVLGGIVPDMLSLVTVLLAHSLLRRACTSMMAKRISMHVLMFLVLVGAIYLGQVTEAATVAFLVNASEWIVGKSQVAVEKELGKSLVGTSSHATLLSTGGGPRSSGTPIRIEDLRPKDVVLLKSGSTVPTDGRILKADTFTVNESSVTGEALPVDKSVGEKLLSGTVVVAGVAEMECTAPAAESFQGKLQAAVEDARNSRSEMEELVNRFAEIYTPIVVLLSVLLALWSSNLTSGLTVSRLGTDKTGTLTKGSFELHDIVVMPGQLEKRDLLKLLAALESQDSHPLANSLVRSYVGCAAEFAQGAPQLPKVDRFTRVESQGVWGIVEGQVVGAGSKRFLDSMAIDLPSEAEEQVKKWEQEGGVFTVVYMTMEDDVAMILRLEDELREDAQDAVQSLQALGVYVAMLTGDERKAAEAVAQTLGIQERRSKMTPNDKEIWVRGKEQVQQDLESGLNAPLLNVSNQDTVCMLGDGLNDGPALAAADLGVAIASGLQLPCDAADVVIGSGGAMLKRFVQALHFAKRCKELIQQNLVFAICVKLGALILAFTGHLYLTFGVLSDSGSLLLVVLNSLRPLAWEFIDIPKTPTVP